jgi:hypothetical protein
MSLSLYRVPDGQQSKGQSAAPCPSVYSPAAALGSLSSVALSSAQVLPTLARTRSPRANYRQFSLEFSSGFLAEATNQLSSGFLREATGDPIFFKSSLSFQAKILAGVWITDPLFFSVLAQALAASPAVSTWPCSSIAGISFLKRSVH